MARDFGGKVLKVETLNKRQIIDLAEPQVMKKVYHSIDGASDEEKSNNLATTLLRNVLAYEEIFYFY